MSSNEKISVVVPVYNVASYLGRCLRSLGSQTFKNIEIILVDDGSTDGSGELCDDAACHDERIKVIHKANGGLSDARNVGIAAATGTWIFLLDSDDYVSPYCFSRMLEVAISEDADIVECQFMCVSAHDAFNWSAPDGQVVALNKEEALAKFLDYDGTWIMAWNKLYKADLFIELAFPKGKLNEDEFITPYLVDSCHRYAIISDELYAYYQRPGSIMHSGFSDGRLDVLDAHAERYAHFSAKYPGVYDGIIAFHWFSCLVKMFEKYRNQMSADQLQKVSAQRKACLSVLDASELSLKRHIQICIYKLFPRVGILLAEKGASR